MKKKCTAVTALVVLLIYVLMGGVLAEESDVPDVADTLTTEVSVTFTEAVYFVELTSGGMDIDFGEQLMPKLDIITNIHPSDGDHTLRVCDRRDMAGRWRVDAVMTEMMSGDESFPINLHFFNSTITTGLTVNLIGTDPYQNTYVTQTTRKILEATTDLTQGNYDMTTREVNIRLTFSAANAEKVKPLSYKATITWTLTLTP